MTVKRLALLAPLLAARSSPATCACNAVLEPAVSQGQPCTAAADSVGCTDSLPSIGPYQIYWGDLHGHTALSDRKGSLDHYFTNARDTARLDFVVVSDHDYCILGQWELPRETWALTNDKVDEYTVDGRFVAIAGYEWTSNPIFWNSTKPIFSGPARYYNHKNVYFPGRVDYIFGAMDSAYLSPDLLAEAVRKVGGLIHNNPPIRCSRLTSSTTPPARHR